MVGVNNVLDDTPFVLCGRRRGSFRRPRPGANDRIRIGIVGLGGRGSDHQRAYSTIPEARITALCDVKPGRPRTRQARVTKPDSSRRSSSTTCASCS